MADPNPDTGPMISGQVTENSDVQAHSDNTNQSLANHEPEVSKNSDAQVHSDNSGQLSANYESQVPEDNGTRLPEFQCAQPIQDPETQLPNAEDHQLPEGDGGANFEEHIDHDPVHDLDAQNTDAQECEALFEDNSEESTEPHINMDDDQDVPAETQVLGLVDDTILEHHEQEQADQMIMGEDFDGEPGQASHAQPDGSDAMLGVEGDVPEYDPTAEAQDDEDAMEDIQNYLAIEEELPDATAELPETFTHVDADPTLQAQEVGAHDERDSLFVPLERASFLTPHSNIGSSWTHDLPNDVSAPPTAFGRLSVTSDSSALSSSSGMLTPTSVALQPVKKSSASIFSKIRNIQKRIQREKAVQDKLDLHAGARPGGETYLSSLAQGPPKQQASMDISPLDENDKAEKQAQAEFQKTKNRFDALKKKKGGKLSFTEEVEWMKVQAAEKARKEKRKRDLELDREDDGEGDLFPEFFGGDSGIGDGANQDEAVLDDDPAGVTRKPASAVPARISMVEAELRSMEVALGAERDNPRKKKRGAQLPDDPEEPLLKGGRKGSGSKASGSRGKGGARKSAKDKKALEQADRMAKSLMYSDVFVQQAGDDAPEQQGTFKSRNKRDALLELIASVPTENQKSAKDDMAALLRDTKDFDGRGYVKADVNHREGNMWKVKGMKTSLKSYQIMGTAFMR